MDGSGENGSRTESILERIELTCPSTLPSVERVEEIAQGMALRTGFDEDTACNIGMVVREAAINASKHGNGFAPETIFVASLQRTEDGITVRIADRGVGMDVETLPDPLDPSNLFRASGRGVFLMRAIMDEVHFRPLEPGTEVTLKKFRNPNNTEASSQMETKIRHVEGVTVLDLGGKITLGEESGKLRSAVQEALSAGSKRSC